MQSVVRLLAPGFSLDGSFAGSVLACEAAGFLDLGGRRVAGIEATFTMNTKWRSKRSAGDRAMVIGLGLFDLVQRWPTPSAQVKVTVDGVGHEADAIQFDALAAYELGAIISEGTSLPATSVDLPAAALERTDLLHRGVLALTGPQVDELLGPLAQISAAASAGRPADRLGPLWSALELLRPNAKSDLSRIDGIHAAADFVTEERHRGDIWRELVAHRTMILRDSWFHAGVRNRLRHPSRRVRERMKVATTVAYAMRSAIVHGHWARLDEDRRPAIVLAEKWLWTVVEREVEFRAFSRRLDALDVRRHTVTTF